MQVRVMSLIKTQTEMSLQELRKTPAERQAI